MGNAVKFSEKVPHEDVFRLIPATEEKRLLKKIEENTTKGLREETDKTLDKYGEGKLALLIQIGGLIDASNKAASDVNKMMRKAGFLDTLPKHADVRATLRYITASAEFLTADQLRDEISMLTKLEERKETKYAAKHLYEFCSGLPAERFNKLLSLSDKMLEKKLDPDGVLSPISKLQPRMRASCFDGLLSLTEEMLERDMNPKPAVSYFCELPTYLLEAYSDKILELSMKLTKRGIDPKGTIWSISILPGRQAVDIDTILSSSMKLADQMDPRDKILLLSATSPKLVERKQVDKILKLAHANVNRGWMRIEQCWEMEKSMNSLLVYSSEELNLIAPVAIDLLKHNVNPNDLLLLTNSISQFSPEKLDTHLDRLRNLMFKMKETRLDTILTPTFYSSEEFKESGFGNFVFYKLSQTLQKNPEKFDGQLVEVERKVISGLNPDVVFKRPT